MKVNRERYTPNDVGPSPEEWKAPRLSDVSSLVTNGFVGTATPYYTNKDGVPYLYGTNVRANRLDFRSLRYITHQFHREQEKTNLKEGDLLTVQSGHIGTTAVVTKEMEGANCHALIVTRLIIDKVEPNFLSYYLNSEIGIARMRGLVVGSTIVHINTKDLKKFRVLLPKLEEQTKIAQILSTWDQAIETTEKLIENSKAQKNALMQQLLTGRKRLPGFSGEWKATLISKFIIEDRTPGSTGDTAKKLTVKLYGKGVIPKKETRKGSESTQYFRRKGGQFIYSKLDFLNGAFGIIPAELDGYESTLDLPAFDFTSDANPNWFLFFVSRENFYSANLGLANGGRKARRVNPKDMLRVRIDAPDYAEQTAIASVLSTASMQVENYKHQLLNLQKQKKGLMQQLLTGKRRVKVDA